MSGTRWLTCVLVLLVQGGAAAPPGEDFILGVCTHYAQEWERCNLSLPLVQQAGVGWIRDEMTWAKLETRPGKLVLPAYYQTWMHTAFEADIQPLIVLDYANKFYDHGDYPCSDNARKAFLRYVEFVARTYKGKVRMFEVWNEWDNGCGMPGKGGGQARDYARLLKAVYHTLKSIDPDCIVLGGAVSGAGVGDKTEGWTKRLLEAGALDFMDGFSIHPYTYDRSCETYTNPFPQSVDTLQNVLRRYNGGKKKPLYITEMGWTTSTLANDAERQAAYLARFLLLAKTRPCIKGAWIYNLTDCVAYIGHWWTPGEAQRNFGILRQDITPKAAYWAVRDLSDLIQHGHYVGRKNMGDPTIFALKFSLRGRKRLALWTTRENGLWRIMFASENAYHAETVTCWKPGRGTPVRLGWNKNLFSIYLDKSPILLDEDFDHGRIFYKRWIPTKQQGPTRVGRQGDIPLVLAGRMPRNIRLDGDLSDWGKAPFVPLAYEALQSGADDPAGRTGKAAFAWDKKNLYLAVTIADPKHCQPNRGATIWSGDSLQVGFIASGATRSDYVEIGVARRDDGNIEKACWHLPESLAAKPDAGQSILSRIEVAVRRDTGRTTYELAIPTDAIFFPEAVAGTVIRATLVVNDNNGGGRRGYLHWGRGVARSKNPDQYGEVILLDTPPDAPQHGEKPADSDQ